MAKASINDVVTAARNSAVSPWHKFGGIAWNQNGMRTSGTSPIPPGIGANIIGTPWNVNPLYWPFVVDMHSDAVECTALNNNKYILLSNEIQSFLGGGSNSSIYMYRSDDGLNWHSKQLIAEINDVDFNCQFPFFVALKDASDDVHQVGREFYIYYSLKDKKHTHSTYGDLSTWHYQIIRRKITVDTPVPPVRTEPDANYRITFRHSGKCIRPVAGSYQNTVAEQWEINEDDETQLWRFEHVDGDYYVAINKGSGKALNIYDFYPVNPVGVWTQYNSTNQQIKFVDAGDGYYTIYDRLHNNTLDVTGSSQSNGARIISIPFHGGASQQVKFVSQPGLADILWYETWNNHGISVLQSDGKKFNNAGTWITNWGIPDWAGFGDINKDGYKDILWYEEGNNYGITVATSTGNSFISQGQWITGWGKPDWAGVADVNNDKLADLIWYQENVHNYGIVVATSDGTGLYKEGSGIWIQGIGKPDWAGVGDVDGDGNADLLWYETWNNYGISVIKSNGQAFTIDGQWITGWGAPDWAGVGDFDGDGLADLFWYEEWNDGGVHIATSTGSGFTYLGKKITGWGKPDWANVEDVNGDGFADLLWYNDNVNNHGIVVATSDGNDLFKAGSGIWFEGIGKPDWAASGNTID